MDFTNNPTSTPNPGVPMQPQTPVSPMASATDASTPFVSDVSDSMPTSSPISVESDAISTPSPISVTSDANLTSPSVPEPTPVPTSFSSVDPASIAGPVNVASERSMATVSEQIATTEQPSTESLVESSFSVTQSTSSVNPTGPNPYANIAPVEVPTPVHPIVNHSGSTNSDENLVGANRSSITGTVTGFEMNQIPNASQQELNSPMKATAPVPGPIGSTVSGTIDNVQSITGEPAQVNSVSFNDPAKSINATPDAAMTNSSKKKTSKTTMIALIIVALMTVIALAAVFILQLV